MLVDVVVLKSVGIVIVEGTILYEFCTLTVEVKILYELCHTECEKMYELYLLIVWIVKPDDCMNCD